MSMKWPPKDPAEVLDYRIEWAPRLDSDTITSSAWVVAPAGLTISRDESAKRSTTVWLSGGVLGTTYTVTNTILTAKGRTEVQAVTIDIKTR